MYTCQGLWQFYLGYQPQGFLCNYGNYLEFFSYMHKFSCDFYSDFHVSHVLEVTN